MAKIAIVEDDVRLMYLMASIFGCKGHHIIQIGPADGPAMPGTTDQLVAYIQHIEPDVILLDANLGFDPNGKRLNGEEIANKLPTDLRIVNISSDPKTKGAFGQTAWHKKDHLDDFSQEEEFVRHVEKVLASPRPA